MKIGVLSDIHGNSVALEAVLPALREQKVEHLFILGDFVGYYYHPDEVLKSLSEFDTTMVRGNHETMLEEARADSNAEDRIRKEFGSGVSEALLRLSTEQLDMLLALPEKREVSMGGMTFLLCHGSPSNNDEYVYPDASEEKLKACADQGVDAVLMGHTHYPLLRQFDSTILLNPGSVGQPRDKGSSASWAIIDTQEREARLFRTPFDGDSVAAEARAKDPGNPYLADVLLRKRT